MYQQQQQAREAAVAAAVEAEKAEEHRQQQEQARELRVTAAASQAEQETGQLGHSAADILQEESSTQSPAPETSHGLRDESAVAGSSQQQQPASDEPLDLSDSRPDVHHMREATLPDNSVQQQELPDQRLGIYTSFEDQWLQDPLLMASPADQSSMPTDTPSPPSAARAPIEPAHTPAQTETIGSARSTPFAPPGTAESASVSSLDAASSESAPATLSLSQTSELDAQAEIEGAPLAAPQPHWADLQEVHLATDANGESFNYFLAQDEEEEEETQCMLVFEVGFSSRLALTASDT